MLLKFCSLLDLGTSSPSSRKTYPAHILQVGSQARDDLMGSRDTQLLSSLHVMWGYTAWHGGILEAH